MDAVLLFSGQGAQKVGMGKDLYDQYPVAKALIEQADKALGESLSAVMFEGPGEELTRTCNSQPALYVHGLACLAVLKELVPSLNPVAAAGLSLGEFTAHAAAGTYSFEEGLRLVQKRGAFMEEACNATKGTMAAMIGGKLFGILGILFFIPLTAVVLELVKEDVCRRPRTKETLQ